MSQIRLNFLDKVGVLLLIMVVVRFRLVLLKLEGLLFCGLANLVESLENIVVLIKLLADCLHIAKDSLNFCFKFGDFLLRGHQLGLYQRILLLFSVGKRLEVLNWL